MSFFSAVLDLFKRLPRPHDPRDEHPMNELPYHPEGKEKLVKVLIEPSPTCFHEWREAPRGYHSWDERRYGKMIDIISPESWYAEFRFAYHCRKCGGELVTRTIEWY